MSGKGLIIGGAIGCMSFVTFLSCAGVAGAGTVFALTRGAPEGSTVAVQPAPDAQVPAAAPAEEPEKVPPSVADTGGAEVAEGSDKPEPEPEKAAPAPTSSPKPKKSTSSRSSSSSSKSSPSKTTGSSAPPTKSTGSSSRSAAPTGSYSDDDLDLGGTLDILGAPETDDAPAGEEELDLSSLEDDLEGVRTSAEAEKTEADKRRGKSGSKK